MDEQEIFTQLQDIFRDIFDDEELILKDTMSANDIEDWDSLVQIRIIVSIEKQFKIKLPAQEWQKLTNVGEMKTLIKQKL